MEYLDDSYLTPTGSLDLSVHSDSNIWNINSFAAAAGYRDAGYFRDVLLSSTSLFHAHIVEVDVFRKDGGKERTKIYVTHTDSAAAGGKLHREYQTEQRRLRATDVSSKNSE